MNKPGSRFPLLIILICLASLFYPAHSAIPFDPWNKTDLALEGAYLAGHAIDWAQTITIARNPDKWHEHNPALGKHPKAGQVNLVMGIMAVVQPIIAHLLPNPYRRIYIGTTLAAKVFCVGNNLAAGIGWGAKW